MPDPSSPKLYMNPAFSSRSYRSASRLPINECRLGDLAFPCDLVELARQRSRQIEGVALLIGPLEWSGSNASSA